MEVEVELIVVCLVDLRSRDAVTKPLILKNLLLDNYDDDDDNDKLLLGYNVKFIFILF